jgi:hypothetical protein
VLVTESGFRKVRLLLKRLPGYPATRLPSVCNVRDVPGLYLLKLLPLHVLTVLSIMATVVQGNAVDVIDVGRWQDFIARMLGWR